MYKESYIDDGKLHQFGKYIKNIKRKKNYMSGEKRKLLARIKKYQIGQINIKNARIYLLKKQIQNKHYVELSYKRHYIHNIYKRL